MALLASATIHLEYLRERLFYYHDNLVAVNMIHPFFDRVFRGELPLWSHEISSGQPIWMLFENFLAWDPVAIASWTAAFLLGKPSNIAYQWACIAWMLLFAIGGALCSRRISRDPWMTMLVFALLFGGPIASSLSMQAYGFLLPFRYLPLVILHFLRFQEKATPLRAAAFGGWVALSSSGYQTGYQFVFLGLFLATYLAAKWSLERKASFNEVKLLGLAGLVACLGLLPTLLAGLELLKMVPVARLCDPSYTSWLFDRATAVAGLFDPIPIWADHGSTHLGPVPAALMICFAASLPTWAIAAATGRAGAKEWSALRPSPLELAWTVSALTALVLCVGGMGFKAMIQNRGPFLGLRNWGFLLTPVVLGLSQLAVAGFQRLAAVSQLDARRPGVQQPSRQSWWACAGVGAIALALLSFGAWHSYRFAFFQLYRLGANRAAEALPSTAWVPLLSILGGLSLGLRALRLLPKPSGSSRSSPGAAAPQAQGAPLVKDARAILVNLIAGSGVLVLGVLWSVVPTLPQYAIGSAFGVALTLLLLVPAASDGAPASRGGAPIVFVVSLFSLALSARHFTASMRDDARFSPLLSPWKDPRIASKAPRIAAQGSVWTDRRGWKYDLNPDVPYHYEGPTVWRRHFATQDSCTDPFSYSRSYLPPPISQVALRRHHDLVSSGLPEAVLQRVLGVSGPLVRIVHRAVPAENAAQALSALKTVANPGQIDRTAVVEGEVPDSLRSRGLFDAGREAAAEDSWRLAGFSPGDVRLSVRMGAEGYLVYGDNHAEGWTAFVDGRRAPVLAANVANKAVRLSSGDHELRFVYRPLAYLAGFCLRAALIVALLVACLIR